MRGHQPQNRSRPSSEPAAASDVRLVRVELRRPNSSSLGFKIVAGNSAEPMCDRGIYVAASDSSRSSGLRPYDRILKVNGRELAGAEPEATQTLLSANEPVVVDVLRRMNPWRVSTASSHVTAATQTDPISSDEEEEEAPLMNSSVLQERMGRLEMAADGFIDDTDLEEECASELANVEYEEVTLERTTTNDRVGLTLCYGPGEDQDTDIFVSEIEARSIAHCNGRIHQGDQILQINGVDVHTRNQAIELFRQDRDQVTLLLARSTHQNMESESACDEKSCHQFPGFLSPMPEHPLAEEEEDDTADSGASAHEKDSGISRTTDSEPELPPPFHSPSQTSQLSNDLALKVSLALDESSTTATATPTEATCNKTPSSATTPFANGTSSAMSSPGSEAPPQLVDPRLTRSDSDGDLERELACLHREMESIRLECDRLIAKHAKAEETVMQQVQQAQCLMATMDSLSLTRPMVPKGLPPPPSFAPPPCPNEPPCPSPLSTPGNSRRRRLEDTSSAYNTGGESCRSTPLNMERQRGKEQSVGRAGLPQVMYTSPENLHQTIQLQQRLLRQAMIQQAQQFKLSPDRQEQTRQENSDANSEWKVKRRSDGSRYITKRPIRNKLLRERAQQLTNERFGISTDDDAASELKIGRFWSREERKKHVEKSRERKIRQQELIRRKMVALNQAADQTILQLSHKKMQRRKDQQLFDKFTTIQEFLSHGNKQLGGAKTMGILSVTTV